MPQWLCVYSMDVNECYMVVTNVPQNVFCVPCSTRQVIQAWNDMKVSIIKKTLEIVCELFRQLNPLYV